MALYESQRQKSSSDLRTLPLFIATATQEGDSPLSQGSAAIYALFLLRELLPPIPSCEQTQSTCSQESLCFLLWKKWTLLEDCLIWFDLGWGLQYLMPYQILMTFSFYVYIFLLKYS